MEVVVYYCLSKLRILLFREVVEQDLAYMCSDCENWRFFWVKTQAINAILIKQMYTGTEITSGLVGLKFLLKIPQTHTIDLWEQVVVC